MARMTLDNFRSELANRGFDGFQSDDLWRYINFGYREVARLTRWTWEKTSAELAFAVGDYRKELTADLPTLKEIISVGLMGDSTYTEKPLDPLSDSEFYRDWSVRDLDSVQNHGDASYYYLTHSHLYVVPPTETARTVLVNYYQRITELTDAGHTPITPADYDEAILIAAEIRCHERARQPEFARDARKRLETFFDDAIAENHSQMPEQTVRVRPNGWDRWLA